MAGLYVPLDVHYFEDDKIIDVGPMAELLYVRSLAFAKRAGTDGKVSANQLRTISYRLTNVRRLAERLVAAGLWEQNGNGWVICAWAAWNRLAGEADETKSASGSFGNHRRWHVGSGRVPKDDCPWCIKEGLV